MKLVDLTGTFAKSGCPFFKVDDEHGIAFGWAIISTIDGEPYFDTQGDHIPMAAVIKAAERFMKNSRAGDEQHDERRAGDIPFAMPIDASLAKSLFNVDMAMEGLVIGFKPYNKALLGKIKSGERRGFSIGGVLHSANEVGKSLLGKSIMTMAKPEEGRLVAFAKARATAKSTRRIFNDFEIDFISAVDWPAQEGALVAIVKSADGDDVHENVLWMRKAAMPPKKPFGAQPQQQPPGSLNGAPGMLQQAAAQPLLPTQQMAAAPTGALPMAPNGGSLPVPAPKLTGEADGHQHAILLDEVGENGVGYTGFGISGVGVSHRHAFVMNPDGSTTIAVNDGHTHTPDGSAAPVELDEEGNPIEPAEGNGPPPFGSDKAKEEFGGEGELAEGEDGGDMPPFAPRRDAAPSSAPKKPSEASASDEEPTDSADGKKKPAPFAPRKRAYSAVQNSDLGVGLENKETAMDAAAQIAALKKQLDNAIAYGELTDAQKAHYRVLSKRDQESFLGMTAVTRDSEVKKAADADPVVYTTSDGIEIRKSDGKLAELQAKKIDAQEKELTKARDIATSARFEKRADAELRHYPKSAAVRGRILKAVETEFAPKDASKPTEIEKKQLEEAMGVLKAGDKALSKSYTRSGVMTDRGSDEVEVDEDAEEALDTLAKKYAKENKISFHKAYDVVVQTDEGQRLYNKAMGHDEFMGDQDSVEIDDFADDDSAGTETGAGDDDDDDEVVEEV